MDRGEGTIHLPENCTFTKKGNRITIEGPNGTVERQIHNRRLTVKEQNGTIELEHDKDGKKAKRIINAVTTHIKNMIKGATDGITYKLQICSGHFPMNVNITNNTLKVENFIGEKVPRTLTIEEDVDVTIEGDEIKVTSTDKEKAGKVASRIEELTKRSGFDKRIFQDGIYIIEKDGQPLV